MPPQQLKIDGEKPGGRKPMKGEAPKTEYKCLSNLWPNSEKDISGETQGTQKESSLGWS